MQSKRKNNTTHNYGGPDWRKRIPFRGEGCSIELEKDVTLVRLSPLYTVLIKSESLTPRLRQDEDYTAEAPRPAGALNASEPAARLLLRELSLLDNAGDQLNSQPGRRAVLLSLHALPAAAAEAAGPEAARELSAAVQRYAAAAEKATGRRALTLLLTQPVLSRRARSLLAETTAAPVDVDLNLAGSYSDDYPVIFNILLITSIFLIYILVAFSSEYGRSALVCWGKSD